LGSGIDWYAVLADLLKRVKLSPPDQLAEQVSAAARRADLEVTVYLVDHEQRRLWPLPQRAKVASEPLLVDGTLGGRAFRLVRTYPAED